MSNHFRVTSLTLKLSVLVRYFSPRGNNKVEIFKALQNYPTGHFGTKVTTFLHKKAIKQSTFWGRKRKCEGLRTKQTLNHPNYTIFLLFG